MKFLIVPVYFIAAIAIPLIFTFMLWSLFRITGQRDTKFFWGGLIGILGVIPVLSDLALVRGEYVNGILKDIWIPPGIIRFFGEWSSRSLIYLILGFGLIVIVKSLYKKQIETRVGSWLFFSYILLIAPSYFSAVAGTRPTFNHFMLYQPIIFTLVYLASPSKDWLWYVKQFKHVLLAYVSLSAILGMLAPTWSTAAAMTLIPGFNFRLHGIFQHSNSLGMAALVYLVLDMADGARATIYRKLAWLVSIGVLIATQSKTAWIGAILAYFIFFIYKLSNQKNSDVANSTTSFTMGSFVLLVVVGSLSLLFGGAVSDWFSGLDAQTYNSLTSLTGRTTIWNITIRSWQDNPIFGYGPGLWDVDYRLKYAPQYRYIAGMAHNQFFQTLGESGLLGVLGLSIYMATLIKVGLQHFSTTRGVSLALVAVFLVRSITETPFNNLALDMMFFAHFILFVLLLSMAANAQSKNPLIGIEKL